MFYLLFYVYLYRPLSALACAFGNWHNTRKNKLLKLLARIFPTVMPLMIGCCLILGTVRRLTTRDVDS